MKLSEAERGNLNLLKEAPDWCISDPDRHILLSVAWKKQSLASMLLSSGDVAENMEKSLRKPMAAYGYKLEGFLEESLDGATASGFRYSYTAQGIGMTGESFSVKKGKNILLHPLLSPIGAPGGKPSRTERDIRFLGMAVTEQKESGPERDLILLGPFFNDNMP